MGPPTTLSVPDKTPRVYPCPAAGSTPYHSPTSVSKLTIRPCLLQLACVSVLHCALTCLCLRQDGHSRWTSWTVRCHGLGSGRHSRHNQVNKILRRVFISTGQLATREPHSVCTRDKKRRGVKQLP